MRKCVGTVCTVRKEAFFYIAVQSMDKSNTYCKKKFSLFLRAYLNAAKFTYSIGPGKADPLSTNSTALHGTLPRS